MYKSPAIIVNLWPSVVAGAVRVPPKQGGWRVAPQNKYRVCAWVCEWGMILNSIIERVVILSPTCGSFDLGTPLSPRNERAALDVLCSALDERLQLLSNLSTGRSDGDGGGGGDGGGEESDTVMDALFRENAATYRASPRCREDSRSAEIGTAVLKVAFKTNEAAPAFWFISVQFVRTRVS